MTPAIRAASDFWQAFEGTGFFKTYTNPQATAFQPIQDTAALPVCP